MNNINTILKEQHNQPTNDLVYNFLKTSDSSKFYDELFSDKFEKEHLPELYQGLKQAHQQSGEAYKIMEEIVSFLEKKLNKDAIVIEIGGGIFQRRSANAYLRFNNYFPLDISYSSIKRYSDEFKKVGFVADAKELPFKDNSIDCVFTHTFLEHPLAPEKVLSEIARILKSGGIIVHNDAWFSRWWQRFGVVNLKKFENMTIKEKAITVASKITELSFVRLPPIIIKRFFNQLFNSNRKNISLQYNKLKPNYNLHLGCDEDAANDIDPINAIRFYESRNFKLITPLSLKQRLFYPNKYIVLQKQN